ncbi:DUF4468 domain-containing protein [Spirosoma sp. 209]|uniref:DUF4468 domain-containing protein n=1 Tax=Spirosoma sp. 209 TaxID=1955701 RepID=UPI00098D50D1|nr:DUF4468 domain-containing protein [Spirosoma sp. 209]
MKAILLLLLLPSLALCQGRRYKYSETPVQIDSATGGMIYSEVIPVEGASANELYSRGKAFIAKVFTNESAVTLFDDSGHNAVGGRGKLVMNLGLGTALLTGQLQSYYEMAIEIRAKDGRYRYELSDIEVVNGGYRIKVDDAIRKNKKAQQLYQTGDMSQKEYDKLMSDKNPVMAVIRQLKNSMSAASAKNDF